MGGCTHPSLTFLNVIPPDAVRADGNCRYIGTGSIS